MFEQRFKIKFIFIRINGMIKMTFNVDLTFYSSMGFERSRKTTMTPLFLRIHTFIINVYGQLFLSISLDLASWKNKMFTKL